MRRLVTSVVAAALFVSTTPAAAKDGVKDLKVFAHLELGGTRPYGDVAVAGRTALVGSAACPAGPAMVVDVAKPTRPAVASTVDAPGQAVAGNTRGLGVVGSDPCTGRGVSLYDLAQPGSPVSLGQVALRAGSVDLATRRDGRTILVVPGEAVQFLEVTDSPGRLSPISAWAAPDQAACTEARTFDNGRQVLAVCGDRIYHLDLATPSSPVLVGTAPGAVATGRVSGVVLGDRALALAAQDKGLRVLELQPDETPREAGFVTAPGGATPGPSVASGELAFVAWHGDGLRVLDLETPGYPAVARFVPPGDAPDVVGVALLPSHLLVVDATTGLWVVDRPPEGAKNSKKDDITLFLVAFGAAAILAFLIVPALVRGMAAVGEGAAAPRGAAVPARLRRIARYPRKRRYG